MKLNIFIFLFAIYFLPSSLFASTASIKGIVILNKNTPVKNVIVYALNNQNQILSQTKTTKKGRFELKQLEKNKFYVIKLSLDGYKQKEFYYLEATNKENIIEKYLYLEPAIIIKNKTMYVYDKKTNSSSKTTISKKVIKNIAASTAFSDLSSSIKLLPGVVTNDAEGASIYARGGKSHETIGVMDDIYLPYPYFWNGFLSVFNPLIIHDYTFYNGGFDARYGNALSGIINVKNNYIPPKKYTGEIDVNFSELNSSLKGPLFKRHSFWNLSFRKSYYDKTVANLQNQLTNVTYPYLENTNLILSTPLTKKTNLRYSYYYFKDGMDFSNNQTEAIKEALDDVVAFETIKNIHSLSINKKIKKNYFLKSTLSYLDQNNFFNKYHKTPLKEENILFNYNLYKTTYKTELTISHQTNNKTSIGLEKTHFEADKETTIEEKINFKVNYEALYISQAIYSKLKKKKIETHIGLRGERFPNSSDLYVSPRFSTSVFFTPELSASYKVGTYYQKNLSIINYLEFTYPNAKPEKSIHNIVSIDKFWNKKVKTSIELYYKNYSNIIQKGQEDNYLLENITIENLNNTIGYSKGIDILCQLLEHSASNISGWISYSYLKSKRKNNYLENYGYYYTDWDQTHTISTYVNKKLDHEWHSTIKILLGSGKPYSSSNTTFNDKRKKATLTLDIWFTKNKIDLLDKYNWIKSSKFNIGVVNILNRKSFLVETESSQDEEQTLLPLSPILAVSIEF